MRCDSTLNENVYNSQLEDWLLPPGCTDEVQPGIDGVPWCTNGRNWRIFWKTATTWESGIPNTLSSSDRRILFTRGVAKAVGVVDRDEQHRQELFEKLG